jgi:hypothetical protein
MYKIYRASRQNSGSIFDTGGIKAETANRTYSVPGAGCETVVNRTSNRPRIERFERPYCRTASLLPASDLQSGFMVR